jgi:catechol 2,3-dioxygenase-like lactoylglutathione lyase family enzyme
VQILKLAWVGTRTDNFGPTVDGSKVEVFGPDTDMNRHFTTGPVVGFLVDDVNAAASELRARGVEILHTAEDERGNAWVHFRAPDGNVYEFTQDPGVS